MSAPTMVTKGKRGTRGGRSRSHAWKFVAAFAVLLGGSLVLTVHEFSRKQTIRIDPAARNLSTEDESVQRSDSIKFVAYDSGKRRPLVPVADRATANEAVDGDEFLGELADAVRLTDQERDRIRPFLGLIARSQRKVERILEPEHRANLEERLAKQTIYGIRIRVAAERRHLVDEMLDEQVPRLAFKEEVPAVATP